MTVLHVIDNALDEANRIAVSDYFTSIGDSINPSWVDGRFEDFIGYGSPLSYLLKIASVYADLRKMVGCEYWSHLNKKSGWHKDTDENLLYGMGVESFPICSCVYYPNVTNLSGGDLLFETMRVSPVTNRLVIFDPSLLHTVDEFAGNRLSVAINPWDYVLEAGCRSM